MKSLHKFLTAASAVFFIASSALAQNAGTVTNHAYAIGKDAGKTGYTSLLCGSAQLAVGQSAADPICKTITGDVTLTAAGATAIGATKVTSATLNADVFSTAHTWAGQQTFVAPILGAATATSINKLAITAPATSATLTLIDGTTLTGPAASGTAMTLGNTETVTGIKTFGSSGAVGRFKLAGTTSGSTVLDASATASGTLTLPAATDTLVGKATTDTLTNKSIVATQLTGTLQAGQFPALTGDVTTSAGALATTIAANAVTNAKMATMAAFTFKGNNTSGSAVPTDVDIHTLTQKASPAGTDEIIISDQAASGAWKRSPVSSLASASGVSSIAGNTGAFTLANGIDNSTNQIQLTAARRTLPTISLVKSGSHSGGFGANGSGTYTTPANVLWIRIRMVGGGAGGSGSGTASNGAGGAGVATCWNTTGAACTSPVLSAGGAATATWGSNPSAGGTASGGNVANFPGQNGSGSTNAAGAVPPNGSNSLFGGGGAGTLIGTGGSALADSGSGGSGGGNAVVNGGPNAGGAGAYVEHIIGSPAATYTFSVGTGGAGGTAGTSGAAGGSGAAGQIIVEEHYGT